MVHNAHSSRDNLFVGYNNLKPLEEALVAGYRGLMLDSRILVMGVLGRRFRIISMGRESGRELFGLLSC